MLTTPGLAPSHFLKQCWFPLDNFIKKCQKWFLQFHWISLSMAGHLNGKFWPFNRRWSRMLFYPIVSCVIGHICLDTWENLYFTFYKIQISSIFPKNVFIISRFFLVCHPIFWGLIKVFLLRILIIIEVFFICQGMNSRLAGN